MRPQRRSKMKVSRVSNLLLPGPETDVRVAVEVMGWTNLHLREDGPGGPKRYAGVSPGMKNTWVWLPSYSTDIAAAWLVVERLISLGGRPLEIVWEEHSDIWRCEVRGIESRDWRKWFDVIGLTAPLAICGAALEALKPDDQAV